MNQDTSSATGDPKQKRKLNLRWPSLGFLGRHKKTAGILLVASLLFGGGFLLGRESPSSSGSVADPLVANQSERQVLYSINSVGLEDINLSSRLMGSIIDQTDGVEEGRNALLQNNDRYKEIIRNLYGDEAYQKFTELWQERTDLLVAYAEAVNAGDEQKKQQAKDSLYNELPVKVAEALESASPKLKEASVTASNIRTVSEHLTNAADARKAKDFTKEQAELSEASRSIETFAKLVTELSVQETPELYKD